MKISQSKVNNSMRLGSMTKSVVTTEDIQIIFGFPEQKARAIKKIAIDRFGGKVAMNDHGVFIDAVFKAVNPTIDRLKEIEALKPITVVVVKDGEISDKEVVNAAFVAQQAGYKVPRIHD